jgi:hypothetical protein
MTRHTVTGLFVTGLLWLATCGVAHAQYFGRPGYGGGYGAAGYGNPYGQPQLSPYLNLLRGGNPAANYYLGVLPEVDRRANTAVFGAAINDLERRSLAAAAVEPNLDEPITTSGHPTAFMNTATYFGGLNAPRTTATGSTAGTRRPAR